MRRKDREVSDLRQQLEIVRRCDSCCIAINDPDQDAPYIVELSFGLEHLVDKDILYVHSAKEGRKLELLAQDPHVSFFMSCGHELVYDAERQMCTMNYESVSGYGIMRLLSAQEALHGLDVLMDHYYPHERRPYHKKAADSTAVYGLEILSMTAKKRKKK